MKKALLTVSFGTTHRQARLCNIEACEQRLAAAFPDRTPFRAYTSGMVLRRLAERDGVIIDSLQQALKGIWQQGYRDVAIQSLHILHGDEYEKILHHAALWRGRYTAMHIGAPLLNDQQDYARLISALHAQMPPLGDDERVVFMGHGTQHRAFAAYACLDHMLAAQGLPALVGAVESYPDLDLVIDRLKKQSVSHIHLMPLMLVAGEHVVNDMASDAPASWKSRLEREGYRCTCWLRGLGENSVIQQMFVDHLLDRVPEEVA
ncbi:sirohydrochlorin cobaltochelatase [Martelella alba]|uniref:Sirohydrochlorin cobaltochelatase n=1 Tax=Martelella alba TaxID=2590451 RepID=A0ABY2SPK4_9HYPH|nr:sirohydrochlorin cobaltochelatase [Martelella alba]TKI08032.1 sirohydrochlorin cobaltochelatase [Martelella alba]